MNHFIVTLSEDKCRQARPYRSLVGDDNKVSEWSFGNISFTGTYSCLSNSKNFWSTANEMLFVHGYPCGIRDLDDSVFSKISKHEEKRRGGWLPSDIGLSGACSIVYINRDRVKIHTDKMGVMPVFETRDDRSTIIGSCFEHVCNTSRQTLNVDYSSVWEFLLNWSIRPPSTLFREISELPHASSISYSPISKDVIDFSLKFVHDGESKGDLASALSDAIARTVESQTSDLESTALFLSGGFDSRVVGENCASDSVAAVTVTDCSSNYETVIAKRIASDIGAKHFIVERDPDFYFAHIDKACLLSNGLSSAADCHFMPILDKPPISKSDRVLTGCYVDYLFKGIQSDTMPRYRWKQLKAGTRLRKKTEAVGDPFFSFRSALENLIDSNCVNRDDLKTRLNRHKIPKKYSKLESEEDYWYSEHHRLFPFSREPTAGTRHMLAGATRWFPVMSSDEILDVYCKVPVSYKMDNSFWRSVVQQVAPKASKHRNANSWVTASSGRSAAIISENAAAVYYRLMRYANPHAAIGSTQNFNKAKENSRLYLLLLEEILEKLEILGFDMKQQQSISEIIKQNRAVFMLTLTLIRNIELCSIKIE